MDKIELEDSELGFSVPEEIANAEDGPVFSDETVKVISEVLDSPLKDKLETEEGTEWRLEGDKLKLSLTRFKDEGLATGDALVRVEEKGNFPPGHIHTGGCITGVSSIQKDNLDDPLLKPTISFWLVDPHIEAILRLDTSGSINHTTKQMSVLATKEDHSR